MAYIGRPLQVANLAVQSGTGDGSDTTPIATLDYATTTNGIAVYLDGVRQLAGTDFNVTAQTTLTFTTAPANGVGVDVYFLGLELSLPTPADASVTTAKIADDAVTLAKMAPGTDGNIISYDASGNPVAIATGSDGQVLTSTGAGSPPAFETAAGTNYAISTGSMDCTSAATTTISGISFTPKYATFIGGVDGSSAAAWGIALTGDVDHHLYDAHQGADGDYAVGGNFANLQTGAGDILQLFCALTSDGASITKNKVSSPTGTLYYKITFFG